jgi:methionyl aminopeptidase
MEKGGMILAQVMQKTKDLVSPGISLLEIDKFADDLISKNKAKPSFKMVKGYDWATCINLNEGIVHGLPDKTRVQRGDLISIDMGVFFEGYHTDMSFSWEIDTNNYESFLTAGRVALDEAIKNAVNGNRVGDISQAIQKNIEGKGVGSCARNLTGHGVGKKLHEEPFLPCFLALDIKDTPLLRSNQALAIEVIYMQGSSRTVTDTNGWTISTADGKISSLFEKTVLVGESEAKDLTPYLWEVVNKP